MNKIPFDPKLGVLVTDQMDVEIDRLLPEVKAVYDGVRATKQSLNVGEFAFFDPYAGIEQYSPLLIECREDDDSWGWARLSVVAINATRELKDYEFRRVVAHELIHVIDPVFRLVYHTPKEDRTKYLTQECEFNAYSGMMAYSIRKNAKSWRNTEHHEEWIKGLGETYEVLKDPGDYINKHRKAGVFDGFYAAVLMEYREILPQDRYDLFIGRIRIAIDDGLAHLQGKTVTPLLAAGHGYNPMDVAEFHSIRTLSVSNLLGKVMEGSLQLPGRMEGS